MYLAFFGLQQAPFSIAPDPRYLFMSERHREALAHLVYGVGGGGGFVLLSGEIGAGKTTICRCFLEQVPAGCQVAYIFNPRLTAAELLQTVCQEFGVALPAPATAGPPSLKACTDALNAHLLAAHGQGRQSVLIIDEAQNLAPDVLEQLRLLTNLETNQRKLLQIMLIGQPELRDMLASPGLEQLAQRVIARYHLSALTAAETGSYLAHRLAVAGRSGPSPFDAAALRRIHQRTGGVPRRINLLADRALLGAYAEGRQPVGRRIVDRAAREVFGAVPRAAAAAGWQRGPRVAWAGGAGLLLLGLLLALWQAPRGDGPASGLDASAEPPLKGSPGAATASASTAGLPLVAQASLPAPAASAGWPLLAPTPGPAAASVAPALAPVAAGADLSALLAWPRDDLGGLRALAQLWGAAPVSPGLRDVCGALRPQQLRCLRSSGGTLAQLRQMDRPALLWLHLGEAAPRVARLVALDARQAVLAGLAPGQELALPLARLSTAWRGEFATLWRSPPGYAEALQPGARGPVVDALSLALAQALPATPLPAGQTLAGELAGRLSAFQVSQSLRADGLAGPTTFMQLNRASGVAEPRLLAAAAEK